MGRVESAGPEERICAWHLLNHTSGYRGVDVSDGAVRWGFSWDKLVRHLQQHERLFAPGAVFNYEHTEHVLLAELIRRQSGRMAAEWARAAAAWRPRFRCGVGGGCSSTVRGALPQSAHCSRGTRLTDQEAIIAMDIENRQRADTSPYERGVAYARWLNAGYFNAGGHCPGDADLCIAGVAAPKARTYANHRD